MNDERWLLFWLVATTLLMLAGSTYLGANVRWYGAREDLYRGFWETLRCFWC